MELQNSHWCSYFLFLQPDCQYQNLIFVVLALTNFSTCTYLYVSRVLFLFFKNSKEIKFGNNCSFFLQLQQILKNYSPWGKPGGGAPCAATLRRKNMPLDPLQPPECHNFGQVKLKAFCMHIVLLTKILKPNCTNLS